MRHFPPTETHVTQGGMQRPMSRARKRDHLNITKVHGCTQQPVRSSSGARQGSPRPRFPQPLSPSPAALGCSTPPGSCAAAPHPRAHREPRGGRGVHAAQPTLTVVTWPCGGLPLQGQARLRRPRLLRLWPSGAARLEVLLRAAVVLCLGDTPVWSGPRSACAVAGDGVAG